MEINKEMFDKKLIELYLKNDYNKDDFNYKAEDFKKQGEKQKSYPLYFSKKKWNMYLKNLKEDKEAYKSYVLGGGSETIEKYIKRGKTYNPPKMAAVASSSRFIYSTFKDKNYKDKISKIVGDISDGKFRFEHILPFKNVSKSFLDGSYISKDKAVFLEAKCHEIFDKHKIILRKAYYESGLLTSDNDFSLQISNVILKDKTVEINKCEFNLDEEEELLLDVKQFITHLFGIANYNLPNTKKELVYFYFNPRGIKDLNEESKKFRKELDKKYELLEKQFDAFSNSKPISSFCKRYNISLRLVYSVNDTFESDLIVDNRLYFEF